MRRPILGMLFALAACLTISLPAQAVPIHRHIVKTITAGGDPLTAQLVKVVNVAPRDSDKDGLANRKDPCPHAAGPGGCPAPVPAVSSPAIVAAPTPASTGYAASTTGLTAPVDPNCESGGDPTTNTGNGYYGAYQFDSQTWDAYGDSAYGEASDAPMSVQTAAANSVPYDAWPNC